jgi:DNA-directed RNA polymerase alpha subunit
MMTMLMVEFIAGTTDGEIRDLAELIRDNKCVRAVRGQRECMALLNAPKPTPKPRDEVLLRQPWDDHGLSVRAMNALRGSSIYTLKELLELSREEVKELPNLGKSTLAEIERLLQKHKLQWRAAE